MGTTSLEYNVKIDKFGVDPLADSRNQSIRDIKQHSVILLNSAYDYRPDLLALDFYKDNELWWVLFVYNGITSIDEFVHGENIKLPDRDLLFQALNQKENIKQSTGVYI
jgi:hypothetical protein